MSKIDFKGTRWYKCDLHLHTTASACFKDRDVTAKQWVDRAIEQGLNCVAITDHNTGLLIDEIKNAALGKNLIVFPGVEITCDPSKVHLLVIFDVDKTSADVRDFLVRADIRAEDFGKQNASTTRSIFEIAELATKDGAIVIPAHIDEYNGLGSISVANLNKFYTECDVNAVQVVHKEFLNKSLNTTGNSELKQLLNDYYGEPTPSIDDATIKDWFTPVKYAIENNLAILTFSDNPHVPKDPKHGLLGIGSRFTWIKMDEIPSLESLRQAFLLPDYRIRNDFDSPFNPYKQPALWIKSLSILNTTITEVDLPLKIEFSPQLNALIGGRGSGKSSVLRFIRGVFNRTSDLKQLSEILADHTEFYKREGGRPKKGILKENSIIEVEFVRNDVLHKFIASNIINSNSQSIRIIKKSADDTWEEIVDEGYIDFFEYEHYSQKQIYEIAQEPNALRERIDSAIDGLEKINVDRELIRSLFLEKSAAIRTAETLLAGRGKIETRIKDLNENIKKLQQSGISDILTSKESFTNESSIIENFVLEIENRERKLEGMSLEIELMPLDLSTFQDKHKAILEPLGSSINDGILKIKGSLISFKEELSKLKEDFEKLVNKSDWKAELTKNALDFEQKKAELEGQGIDAISSFEKFKREKSDLEEEIKLIDEGTASREKDKADRDRLKDEYLRISKSITDKRRGFLQSVLTEDNVKVIIKPFRNQQDFELKLRKHIQKENSTFQPDIDALTKLCFSGNVEQMISEVRNVFLKIRNNEDVSAVVSGYFVNAVKGLTDSQIDEIELFLPEDEIEIQYRTTPTSAFKSLSTASAGQKTTAILTFILSFGDLPLILDQPEDDLDNRLVYELIVDRLKKAKESRQLIVVTHNANLPVNGDAEYITSMDTDSKFLNVLYTGTVEQAEIKKEICDVMEGGEYAFDMRARRYKLNKIRSN